MTNNVTTQTNMDLTKKVDKGMIFKTSDGLHIMARSADNTLTLISLCNGNRWSSTNYEGMDMSNSEIEKLTYLGYADITLSNFRKE